MLKKIQRNPWPYAIIAYFAVFITALFGWIVFAVQNDMELERTDYYEHEIRYQAQIDRVARTRAIREQVRVKYSPERRSLAVTFPKEHTNSSAKGEVHLYRPSDAKLDRKVLLGLSDTGSQQVDVAGLPAGLWKIRITWTANGDDFYFDHPLILAPN